jgi:predicted amidophosphoribosyltransferase
MRDLLVAGLDLLAPLCCPVCDLKLSDHTCCPSCGLPDPSHVRRELCRDALGEYLVLAGGPFDGALRAMVHALKYRQDPAARVLLAGQTMLALPRGLTWSALVPVPAHPIRVRERGWEVVATLASDLAQASGWPQRRLLSRRRYTSPLTGRDLAGRRSVLEGSFAAHPATGCLLLVDDVLTTGTTFRTCRRALLESGARAVDLIVSARTPSPGGTSGAGRRL